MPAEAKIEETGIRPTLRRAVVSGGVDGAIAVSGIHPSDGLAAVIQFIGAGVDVTDVVDLTDEFSISAEDEIDNTGGTDTSGDKLLVIWYRRASQ